MLPDFFLDEDPESLKQQIVDQGGKPVFGGGATASKPAGASSQVFKQIEGLMSEDLVKSIGGIFQFNIKGWFSERIKC